jgi:CubicO group peptidase (beta-lactamase class C family)
VEKNKLKLDDKVFDVLKLEEPQGAPFDKRWKSVTILELLQHTGGWDTGKSFDPLGPWPTISKQMNLKSPDDHAGIIQYMLRKPLQFDPGTQHQYSNFGYCLLGRIIEQVSGSSYEAYVQTHVLAPLEIKRMRLGKTSLKDRAAQEVMYYATNSEDPYGSWYLETLDSAGGWLATAKDVLRFGMAFDKPKQCKILSEASIKLMFARPPGIPSKDKDGKPIEIYYGCGWNVHSFSGGRMSTWHPGSLPGTSAELGRLANGVAFVVLFNARDTVEKTNAALLVEGKLDEVAGAVKRWPR